MQQYRCFFLDDQRYVSKVEIADCADDAAAQRWAEALVHEHDRPATVELWRLARMVARYTAKAAADTDA